MTEESKEEKKAKCDCGCDCGCDCCSPKSKFKHHHGKGGMNGGGIYCVGMIGVAVYYIQQVDGFWPVIVAILKAIVWPAFLLYKVFGMLHM
jgi:hypothetical protein